MALTLDGTTTLPAMGGSTGGVGMGALGGGVVGLLLGGLLGNKNGGLFGGNDGGNSDAQFQAIQNQITSLQGQGAFNDIRNELESVENTFASISSGQTAANASNFNDLSNKVGQVQTGQAAASFTTLQSINDLGRDVTAQSNQAQLQNLNSFNNLTTTLLQGFNGAAMQTQNATNQIISQGTANAAAMAACCCEIKGLIAADGNATRALINDLNVQSLRDQLAAANNQVSNNAQNQYLLSTILAHLKPAGVVI